MTTELKTLQTLISFRAERRSILLTVVFFLSPLLTSISPRLTPLFFSIAGVVLIGLALRKTQQWRELLPPQIALTLCLLFAGYVTINATWSVDPLVGLGKAATLVGLVLIGFASVRAIEVFDRETLVGAAIAFVAGTLLGALFILVELLTQGVLTRTLVAWVPQLSSPKHFKTSNGVLTALKLSKLDQNVNLAMFHLWPGFLALLMMLAGRRRALACAFFFVAIATVIFLSEHDSSKVALIFSCLVVISALKWRNFVVRALAVFWCATVALVIPASFVAYNSGLHLDDRLAKSARARIIIWQFTAEQTLKHPLLGVGVDSTPRLRDQQRELLGRIRPSDFIYPRTMGHHAHNIYLQTWYELGAIGALLFAAAGAAVAMLILLLPASTQPFVAGSFAAFAIIGAFAWGMWQSWFMCAIALLPIYLRVATALSASSSTRA